MTGVVKPHQILVAASIAAVAMLLAAWPKYMSGQSDSRPQARHWKPLFNGHDLDGWEPVHAGHWGVEQGAIVAHSKPHEASGGWLVTKKDYGDFVLRLKFKPNSLDFNSGILVRDPAHGKLGRPAFNGFEVQIAGGTGKDENPTGSIYDVARAYQREIAVHDWTDFEIRCIGDHIMTYLKGEKMAETHTRRSYRGGIGLQIHGGNGPANYMFKDIEIAELPDAPRPFQLMEERLENAPGAAVPLFADNVSEHELTLGRNTGSVWALQTGVLHGSATQQVSRILTKSSYDNFVLEVEFRTNTWGRAGVDVRVPDGTDAPHASDTAETAGYEFRIADADDENPTGSLVGLARAFLFTDLTCMQKIHRAGAWNSARIYALGDHVVTYVNGTKMAEVHANRSLHGHVGFVVWPGTTVEYRSIAIKEVKGERRGA
jgi:hypothetical protein